MKKLPKNVRKTSKGIIVNQWFNSDSAVHACYYRDGNYPDFPDDPDKKINDYMVTAGEKWHHDLGVYSYDRKYNWMD